MPDEMLRVTVAIGRLREMISGLVRIANDLDAQRQAIRDDPELHKEARDHRLKTIASEAQRRIEAEVQSGQDLVEEARRYRDRARQAAQVDPLHLGRVRSLLERGVAPAAIADQAVRLGDFDALRALRSELAWTPLDGQGFADTPDAISGVERRMLEAAEGDPRYGDEAEFLRASRDLDAISPALEAAFRFGTHAIEDRHRGPDRMRLAYAMKNAGLDQEGGE
jgi:hypothetical protein